MTDEEGRIWQVLLADRSLSAEDVAKVTGYPIPLVNRVMSKIGSPNWREPVDTWPLEEGRKDDQGKHRMELLPPEFLFAVADILTFGAVKYEARNWEKGMKWSRPFGALMRHMWAWWGGQGPTTKNFLFGDLDAETGRSHLWHASCCLAFLVTYEERDMAQFDDRHKHREPSEVNT